MEMLGDYQGGLSFNKGCCENQGAGGATGQWWYYWRAATAGSQDSNVTAGALRVSSRRHKTVSPMWCHESVMGMLEDFMSIMAQLYECHKIDTTGRLSKGYVEGHF